uniref:Uncharacterized protein n=1 Tax=viral metagenome TaxID=1070528 RepID=A0A6C0I5T8_9ZZZZ
MNTITKSNILTYITNLLLESNYHIRFHTVKEEERFINYIWKSYSNITDCRDEEEMKASLFIDATEYSFKYDLPRFYFLHIDDAKIHWLLRIGNGNNFKRSTVWGVTQTTNTKYFEKTVKPGDILWFIVSNNGGQAIAFAEYTSHNGRTKTDVELGWEIALNSSNWTIEINYRNRVFIEDKHYFTNIQGQNVNIRKYNEKCKINLPDIYQKLTHQ